MGNFSKPIITREEIKNLCDNNSLNIPQWFVNDNSNRISRGVYKNPFYMKKKIENNETEVAMVAQVLPMKRITNVVTDLQTEDLIPETYKNYVPFGNYDDMTTIISSKQFYPVFITGNSGNGKTMMVEQICAKLKRQFVCISMTPETDESDLMGNYILIDGEMVWRDGPVTVAARQGAVLCIDEIDYGSQNLSALQRVLEGKPFLLKKKNEIVNPAVGFTIIATANTKGKGSEDGRYMFTNVLNEAFLERFPITMEQTWAPERIEKKILIKELASVGSEDVQFAEKLVSWATAIRRTFEDSGCDEVISTRRLVHIAKAYGIFGDRLKAIQYCLNRFDEDTKISFLDLYTKVDASIDVGNEKENTQEPKLITPNEEIPF
jgi:hypothetical protein